MLDSDELSFLKENIEKKFTKTLELRSTQVFKKPIENDERLAECFEFDIGHYPLTPWLNKSNDAKMKEIKSLNFFMPPKPG